ncbi:VOC family protein [Hymenobacter caeli]|uniref:Catechol 2,3-dioxygenase n=1 Tax=Hymenobacter caeli TaxID=2735894 RepID=A0ABX2FKX2_9BACT|nr:VOC family protein [Hymenobacter caeli]NRT17770.1 catechol 2,3-dioxygenase [Hymenobacter caeli]
MPDALPAYTAPAGARVGHVHLQVTDLERSIAFYRDLLGFELQLRYGEQAAFLGAGGYHHHIGLNTWNSLGGAPARTQGAGLYHAALLYPTRADLGRVVGRLVAAGYPLTGAADHGVSEAVYLNDPDGNGLELYWDRPRAAWPRDAAGGVAMYTHPLDLPALVADGQAAG